MNAAQARALAADVLAGIAPEADLAAIGADEDLRAALDLDSMDFLNFVIGISERSGIAIPEADAPRLCSLRGLEAYLREASGRAGQTG